MSFILRCRIGAQTAADAHFCRACCCAAWRLSGGLGAGLGSRVGARAGPGRDAAQFLRPGRPGKRRDVLPGREIVLSVLVLWTRMLSAKIELLLSRFGVRYVCAYVLKRSCVMFLRAGGFLLPGPWTRTHLCDMEVQKTRPSASCGQSSALRGAAPERPVVTSPRRSEPAPPRLPLHHLVVRLRKSAPRMKGALEI